MKQLILAIIIGCMICGYIYTIQEVRVVKKQNDCLNNRIKELDEYNKYLLKDIEIKEVEISYWGSMYDSCMLKK